MRTSIFVIGLLFASAFCIPAKPLNFLVGDYFKGSWRIEKREYTGAAEGPVEVVEKLVFNVTEMDENRLNVGHVIEETNEIDPETSFEMSVVSNRSCTLLEGEKTVATLKFVPFYDGTRFVAVFASESGENVEVLIDNQNHFTVRKYAGGELVHLNFQRIVYAPVPTFFQKYGNLIMMGGMMIMQLVTAKLRPAPPQQEEGSGEANGEANGQANGEAASGEDKPKTD